MWRLTCHSGGENNSDDKQTMVRIGLGMLLNLNEFRKSKVGLNT